MQNCSLFLSVCEQLRTGLCLSLSLNLQLLTSLAHSRCSVPSARGMESTKDDTRGVGVGVVPLSVAVKEAGKEGEIVGRSWVSIPKPA